MIVNLDDLIQVRNNNSNKRIVLLKGSFDLLHTGHIYMMEQAKKYGDILVVIVKPDDDSKPSTTQIIDKIRKY